MGVDLSPVDLHWLWRETDGRLDYCIRLVERGEGIEAAAMFGQFVIWSGLVKICKAHSSDGPLRVDGSLLESKVGMLLEGVRIAESGGVVCRDGYCEDLRRIRHQLDVIAGAVANGVLPPKS